MSLSPGERIKNEFIARAMKRAGEGRYPVVEPTAEDNGKDLHWWLRALDGKSFLFSVNGSAAWLFPYYELKLSSLGKRVVVELGGETVVDSRECCQFQETAHPAQIYVPPSEVRFQRLFETDTVTYCPFKGLARYYGVRVNGMEVSDAFWSYDNPYDKFPANGNASDILRLKGLLGLDRRKLKVTILGD